MSEILPVRCVDVVVTCYNAASFIHKTMEGVLMQQGNLIHKIIVIDDASIDQTPNLLKIILTGIELPFELIIHPNNVGSFLSLKEGIEITNAPFVAVLEGDDYWTDPLKLKKQVDLLNSDVNCSAVAHRAVIVDEKGNDMGQWVGNWNDTSYSLNELIDIPPFQLSSLLFKKNAMDVMPDIFAGTYSNDKVLYISISQKGPIQYSSEVMSAYRDHAEGLHRKKNAHEVWTQHKKFYEMASRYLGNRYDKSIAKAMWNHLAGYIQDCRNQKIKTTISVFTILAIWFKMKEFRYSRLKSLLYMLKLWIQN